MSKAFTKESDDAPVDGPMTRRASASLPPGTKNYLTPGGERRIREELKQLEEAERPTLEGDRGGEGTQQRWKLNQRVAELEQILQSAEIVPPPAGEDARKEVVFGATVTVREVRTGEESRYQIVGVDEVDIGEDRVSWRAPIARVLIGARRGERVRFRFPAGEEDLEIVAVEYE